MSTLRERLDALVFDLTDKAYDKIGQASEFAEDTIEAVFDVVDEVTARAEELKAQAGSRSDDKVSQAVRDFWKGFTDEVKAQAEANAPVAESTEDKARKAYEYLVENNPLFSSHKGKNYWENYYKGMPTTHENFIRQAEEEKAEPKVKPDTFTDYFGNYR